MQIYGIKNCDTVKKALKWLDAHSLEFQFVDFKLQPPSQSLVDEWFAQIDLNVLINKRGTTWRKLPASQQSLDDQHALKQLVMSNPTLVKRPLVLANGEWSVGFNADEWQNKFL